jgi:hypothetical protein
MGKTASFRITQPFARCMLPVEKSEVLTGPIRFRQVPTEITLPA